MSGNFRVAGALLFGALLVGTAFIFRNTSAEELQGTVVVAAPERTYIRPSDSDGDGIKDWQEELVGNTQLENSTITKGTSDSFDKPDTLTEEVALSFFESYMNRSMNGTLNEQNLSAFLQSQIANAEVTTRDPLITRSDIRVGTKDSFAAIRTYGNTVGAIIEKRGNVESEHELTILQRALNANDPGQLAALDPIVAGYTGMLEDTTSVVVPPSLVNEHLLLLNAYQAIVSDLSAMRRTFEDPVASVIRVKRYEDDTQGLLNAYLGIYATLRRNEIEYATDEPGVFFSIFENL